MNISVQRAPRPPVAGGTPRGLLVSRVRGASPAESAGILPGDRLLAANGLVPRDVIDIGYSTEHELVDLLLDRDGRVVTIQVGRRSGEDLGVDFATPTTDGMRRCANACAFCFIDGLPGGMRDTLYIKDDDYRYSFLFGSFITLTNLARTDRDRICYQHLSPLRVSVHSTDLHVRRQLLANPRAPDILEQLDWFGAAGIQFHAQVVIVPGVNDRQILDRTVADLSARYPVVQSLAVVPVGLTRHSHTATVRTCTREDAGAALAQCHRWERQLRRSLGLGFVYASDELYLMAGRRFPAAARYDSYPQIQNGVGLAPLFLAEWRRVRHRLPSTVPARRVVWVCGQAMQGALELVAKEAAQVEGLIIDVTAVPNAFFGTGVTVSGLLTATDVIRALAHRAADHVVVPRAMFDASGQRTLDDWSLSDFAARLPGTVHVASSAMELLEATCAA
jgi:putative radical SAM enzyme (TIGR03279 family)